MCKSGTNTVTQNSAPPAYVQSAEQAGYGYAQQAASTPYQTYPGELVAGMSPDQQQAIATVANSQGLYDPYANAAESSLTQGQALGSAYTNAAGQAMESGTNAATGYLNNAGQMVSAAYGAANPYINAGAQDITAATQPISASTIESYESPYNSQVTQATMAEMENQNAQQQTALEGNAISNGAFGNDRMAVSQAALANQQDLAMNQTVAGLNNQNYAQALSAAQTQNEMGLEGGFEMGNLGETALNAGLSSASAEAGLGTTALGIGSTAAGEYGTLGTNLYNMGATTAQDQSSLGTTALNNTLTGAEAQYSMGTAEQQQQQNILNAAYQQWAAAQEYPFTASNFYNQTVAGTAGLAGGTSSSAYPSASPVSEAAGLVTAAGAGYGLYNSLTSGSAGYTGETGDTSIAATGGRIQGRASGGRTLADIPHLWVGGQSTGSVTTTPGTFNPQYGLQDVNMARNIYNMGSKAYSAANGAAGAAPAGTGTMSASGDVTPWVATTPTESAASAAPAMNTGVISAPSTGAATSAAAPGMAGAATAPGMTGAGAAGAATGATAPTLTGAATAAGADAGATAAGAGAATAATTGAAAAGSTAAAAGSAAATAAAVDTAATAATATAAEAAPALALLAAAKGGRIEGKHLDTGGNTALENVPYQWSPDLSGKPVMPHNYVQGARISGPGGKDTAIPSAPMGTPWSLSQEMNNAWGGNQDYADLTKALNAAQSQVNVSGQTAARGGRIQDYDAGGSVGVTDPAASAMAGEEMTSSAPTTGQWSEQPTEADQFSKMQIINGIMHPQPKQAPQYNPQVAAEAQKQALGGRTLASGGSSGGGGGGVVSGFTPDQSFSGGVTPAPSITQASTAAAPTTTTSGSSSPTIANSGSLATPTNASNSALMNTMGLTPGELMPGVPVSPSVMGGVAARGGPIKGLDSGGSADEEVYPDDTSGGKYRFWGPGSENTSETRSPAQVQWDKDWWMKGVMHDPLTENDTIHSAGGRALATGGTSGASSGTPLAAPSTVKPISPAFGAPAGMAATPTVSPSTTVPQAPANAAISAPQMTLANANSAVPNASFSTPAVPALSSSTPTGRTGAEFAAGPTDYQSYVQQIMAQSPPPANPLAPPPAAPAQNTNPITGLVNGLGNTAAQNDQLNQLINQEAPTGATGGRMRAAGGRTLADGGNPGDPGDVDAFLPEGDAADFQKPALGSAAAAPAPDVAATPPQIHPRVDPDAPAAVVDKGTNGGVSIPEDSKLANAVTPDALKAATTPAPAPAPKPSITQAQTAVAPTPQQAPVHPASLTLNAYAPIKNPAVVSQLLPFIRNAESGGNYGAQNGTSTASGGYQDINATWQEGAKLVGVDVNQYPTAKSAPPAIQDKVNTAILETRGVGPWQASSGVWAPAVASKLGIQFAGWKQPAAPGGGGTQTAGGPGAPGAPGGGQPLGAMNTSQPGWVNTGEQNIANLTSPSGQPAPQVPVPHESMMERMAESPWMALLQAGLGMMSGTSPYAAANIGRGAMEGVNYLQKEGQLQRERQSMEYNMAQNNANRVMQQRGQANEAANTQVQGINAGLNAVHAAPVVAGLNWGATNNIPGTAPVASPTGAPPGGVVKPFQPAAAAPGAAPAAPGAAPAIPAGGRVGVGGISTSPETITRIPTGDKETPSMIVDPQTNQSEPYQQAYGRAKQLAMAPNQAIQKIGQDWLATNGPQAPQNVQMVDTLTKASDSAAATQTQLQELSDAATKFSGGTGAEAKSGLLKAADTFMNETGIQIPGIESASTGAQVISKLSTQLQMMNARLASATGGAEVMQDVEKATPTIANTPQALNQLIRIYGAQAARARAQAAYVGYQVQNGYMTGRDAQANFNRIYPPDMWASRASPVPMPASAAQMKPGYVYKQANGQAAMWTGSGWANP